MIKEPFWKKELKEMLAISSVFFVLFILILLIKKAVLVQYNIEFYAAGKALIGALILGKVVLIFDNLPIVKKMDFLRNIYRVFLRSFIYLIGYLLFSLLEHWVKQLIAGDGFQQACEHAFHIMKEPEFLASLVAVFIIFLLFNTFWVIRAKYGAKALYQLFFGRNTQ